MIYLISYDLNGHERPSAYHVVEKMIKEKSISWAKPLYSQWLVQTNDSLESWHNNIKPLTDSDDRWFITKVNHVTSQGWLDQEVWDWLNQHS